MKKQREVRLTSGFERYLPEDFPRFDGTPPIFWRASRGDEKAVVAVPDPRSRDPYYQDVLPVPVAFVLLRLGGNVGLSGKYGLPSGQYQGERYNFVIDEMKNLIDDVWNGRIPPEDGPAALEEIVRRNQNG